MAVSIFSPPRNKPKLTRPQPSLAIGMPMPQIQTIDRPVNLVDDEGNVHGRIGENPNGPEQVTITPPPGKTNDPPGGPGYASGGTLLIGGGTTWPRPADPSTDNGNYPVGPANTGEYPVPSYGSNPAPWSQPNSPAPSGPVYGPPVPSMPQQQTQPSPVYGPPAPTYGDPNQSQWQANQHQIDTRNAALDARARVLDARSANRPLIAGVNQAKQQVLGLQTQQNQMQRGYYQQQGQDEQAKLAELQGIYQASYNVPDLTRVAEAKNAYASENRRDSAMGVAPPAEIDLPAGAPNPGIAGVRPKIMSQEEKLSERAGYEDPIRNQKLSIAQNILSLQGTDVRQAQLAADQAGMTLNEAQQLVDDAQLKADYANIVSSRADLESQQTGQTPFPGAVKYTDPSTGVGQWVTPEVADQLKRNEQNQGSQFAGLADSQLLNTIPPNVKAPNPLYDTPILNELVRRYMAPPNYLTKEQAEQKARALIQQEYDSRKRTSGLTEALTPGTPTTPAPAGAPAGPTGQLPAGSPAPPAGYPGSVPQIPGGPQQYR